MPDIWSIYLALALTPTLPLIFTLIPHALPSRLTSLAPTSRAGSLDISLICLEIVRSGKAMLSHQVLLGSQGGDTSTRIRTMCEVDTVMTVYLLTALVAHLPIIALSLLKSQPRASSPAPAPPRAMHLLPLIYTYSLIPVLPIVAAAGLEGFGKARLGDGGVGGGFGGWWGMYCVERGSWWRITRPATLLPPLFLTIPLALALFASLYSSLGHPAPEVRPSPRTFLAAAVLLSSSLGGLAYLVLEQVQGWSEDWWPRLFEGLPGLVILTIYTSYAGVWRTYSYWLRFCRAVPAPETDRASNPFSLPTSSKLSPPRRPTSSFYAPPTPPRIHRSLSKRKKPSQADATGVPPLKMRYFADSVYSVDSVRPLSPLSEYSKVTFPSAAAYTRGREADGRTGWQADHPQPVSCTPHPHQLHLAPAPVSTGRTSRNTLRSILVLIRPLPPSRARNTQRSSATSAPFTWSVSASETDTVLPAYLAVPAPVRRGSRSSDGASSVSRYSLMSIATPEGYHDSYLQTIGEGVSGGEAGGRGTGRKSSDGDWVYPEEVFLDFTGGQRYGARGEAIRSSPV